MRRAWMVVVLVVGTGIGLLAAPTLGAGGDGVDRRAAAPQPRAHGPQSDTRFVPIEPIRVYDSRVAAYPESGRLAPNGSRVIPAHDARDFFGNVIEANAVPLGADAVAYNLTITVPTGPNFASVTPGDSTLAIASAVNFNGTADVANAGIVEVDAQRRVKVWNGIESGSIHFIVDVTGYFVEPIFAVVGSGGGLIEGARVDSATRNGVGDYTVNFDRTIIECALSATPESSAPQYATVDLGAANDDVDVKTFDQTGAPADVSFDVVVTC